jgi:hypothetical protein
MNEDHIKSGIFVVKNDLNPRAKELLSEVGKIDFRLEYFLEQELLINVTKHVCSNFVIIYIYISFLFLNIFHSMKSRKKFCLEDSVIC